MANELPPLPSSASLESRDPQAAAVKRLRVELLEKGFYPVIVETNGKKPVGKAWSQKLDVPTAVSLPVTVRAMNTGILCNGLRVVDIDIEDYPKVQEIFQLAEKLLGFAPKRSRSNSTRVLLLYRAAEGEPPKRVIDGKSGKVEVLGKGQQFVAFGTHPSGSQYEWDVNPAQDVSLMDLACVSEQKIEDFLNEAAAIIGADLAKPQLNERQCAQDQKTGWFDRLSEAEKNEVIQICLTYLENSVNDPRDLWVKVIFALKDAALRGATQAKLLGLSWSKKGAGFDENAVEQFDVIWESERQNRPRITVGSLIKMARELGAGAELDRILNLDSSSKASQSNKKVGLQIQTENLPATASELCDLFAKTGYLFERGVPVKLARDAATGALSARALTSQSVIIEAHQVCRPWIAAKDKDDTNGHKNVTLPLPVAHLYLAMAGQWYLLPLNGISTAPILRDDGSIICVDGYDPQTGIFCDQVPDVSALVPDRPSRSEALAALSLLRSVIRTFPFADITECSESGGMPRHLGRSAQHDEAAALLGLLTAVCRLSLSLAPGVLISAPAISGAGTGKGLLARVFNMIAFGQAPQPFTGGHDKQELDKRIGAALMECASSLFIDNLNGVALRSDVLASAITEKPARIRVLGKSEMATLNSVVFITITGNGVTLSEDLVRRFFIIELDARMEDPEIRSFSGDLLAEVQYRRSELLAACLTIWRWGRQNRMSLTRGRPLGSFGQWAAWCRDPLITLGCADPVARISAMKAADPHRRMVAELLETWSRCHGERPVKISMLSEDVRLVADPAGRGRQYLARAIGKLVGVRVGGFTLLSSPSDGTATAYAVQRTDG